MSAMLICCGFLFNLLGITTSYNNQHVKANLQEKQTSVVSETENPHSFDASKITDQTRTSQYTIENGMYFIKNMYSGKYLDVQNQGTSNGTSVIQSDYCGRLSQQIQVQFCADGYYILRPLHTYLNSAIDLHSYSAANTNGTLAQIWSFSSSYAEQKFIIENAIFGGYQIGTMPSDGGKVLDVVDSSLSDGALIQIYTATHTKMSDNWIFEEANFGEAPQYSQIETNSTNCNCLGFALRTNQFIAAGTLGVSGGDTVETVATATINYFENNISGRTIRRIQGVNGVPTYPIDDEYRIALRVKNGTGVYTPYWDYHYMIQLSNGAWAHKRGSWPSENLGYINPSTYAWDGGYNSDTIYFAVSY